MVIKQTEWYSVKQCLDNPRNLYVFGDNTFRVGKGGQAQIRDCKNSYGICTKVAPQTNPEAYFSDSIEHLEIIENDLRALIKLYKESGYDNIIFPSDGLGSGLSEMPERCPKLYERMNRLIRNHFGCSL